MSASTPVAIITGGSGGIAPAIARVLAERGNAIVLTARREGPLQEAAERLADEIGASVAVIRSDATDKESIQGFAKAVLDRFGRIDILVNAAASSTPIGGDIETVDADALVGDLNVKVGGYLRYIQAVVPTMKQRQRGRVVNIGGLTGRSSDTLSGLRNASVSHLTKVLADQLGPFGITVNAVHPGFVRTPHLDELFADMALEQGRSSDAVEADFVARIPTRHIMLPSEIGRAIAFLASADSGSINGESLTIDGGYSRGVYL